MTQDDFYKTLPSNASRNLFFTNPKLSYRVALHRQIYLKDGENREVGPPYC